MRESENDLLINGECGACRQKLVMRVPNPAPGQSVDGRCSHCGRLNLHTVTQKEMMIHYVKIHARTKIRKEFSRR